MTKKSQNPPDLTEVAKRLGLPEPVLRSGRFRTRCPWPENHTHGDADPSLELQPKVGKWFCNVCHRSGDSFGLIKFVLGLDYNSALEWAFKEGLLGDGSQRGSGRCDRKLTRKTGSPGQMTAKRWDQAVAGMGQGGPHRDWLARWRIPEETWQGVVGVELKHATQGEDGTIIHRPALVYPALDFNRELLGPYAVRFLDGRKPKTKSKGKAFALGLHLVPDNSKPVVVCGGDKDWLKARALGFCAIGLLGEATWQNGWPRDVLDVLRGHVVVLALDSDETGRSATAKHISALRAAGLGAVAICWPRAWCVDGAKDLTDFAVAGRDVVGLIRKGLERARRIEFVGVCDLVRRKDQFPPVVSLWADRVLAKNEIAIISGPSKISKSFLTQQLALCLATGIPFLGFDTTQSRVSYVQVEISDCMLAERFEAQLEQFLDGMPGNAIETVNANLRVSVFARSFCLWANKGIAASHRQALEDHLVEFHPDLVILDPLSQILRCDENDNREAAEALAVIQDVMAVHDCGVLLVHHWSKLEIAAMGKRGGPSLSTASRGAGKWQDFVSSALQLYYPDPRDHKIASLDFTLLRNRPELDPIFVIRPTTNCLFFERVDPDDVSRKSARLRKGTREVLQVLADGPRLHKSLVTEVVRRAKCSRAQAADVIAELKAAGKIVHNPTSGLYCLLDGEEAR